MHIHDWSKKMGIFEYNIRNLFVLLILIIGIGYVSYRIITHFSTPNISNKTIKTIIICIFSVIFMASSFFVVETNTKNNTATVTDIVRVGSIGDFIVNYTFFVIDENNNEIVYITPILSSRKYIKKLEDINQGDRVIIQYEEKFNYAIDINKTGQEQLGTNQNNTGE